MQLTSIQMLMWIDILRMINKWNVTISTYRSSRPEVFCKKGVLGNFTKFTGKHLCQRFFFKKKESLAQVFSCEFCEISNNTFSYRTPPMVASVCHVANINSKKGQPIFFVERKLFDCFYVCCIKF